MTQEIIGSEPSITEIKIIFEKELVNLLDKLKLISKENIGDILEQQKVCEKPAEKIEGEITESQEVSTEKPTSEEQPAEPEKSTAEQ